MMRKLARISIWSAVLFLGLVSCTGNDAATGGNPYAEVKGLNDIKDFKVAVLGGSYHEMWMMDHSPQTRLMRVNAVAEQLAAVDNGVADVFLIDGASLIGSNVDKMRMVYCFTDSIISGEYGMAFRKSDTSLCNDMNRFLAQIKSDGTMDEMLQRWTNEDLGKARMPKIDLPEDDNPLVVGTMPTFPFMFIQNGEMAGFEAEMLRRYAQFEGRSVRFDFLDFGALIAALNSGKIDIVASCMTKTEERAKQVLFSDAYYESYTKCYGHVDKAVQKSSQSFLDTLWEKFHDNLIVENRWKLLLEGLWETLVISIFSLLLGTFIGAIICWMRMSQRKVLNGTAKVYIEIMRGVPILVFLMIMFYIIFASSGVSARWVAIMAFSLNFGAYVCEMFRTGIEGVDRGQTEAGLAMGFSKVATFFNFIVPQALKTIIPVYKGEAISLIKSTSIVGYIAIQDLTKVSDIIRSRTFDAFFPLILISIIYFILAWLLGKTLDYVAKKYK